MQINDVVQYLAAGVGIDLSPDGKTAYFVEWSIGELNKVEVGTGMVTTLRKGLSYPEDVIVDWDTGEVFVSERTGAIKRVWPGDRPTVIGKPGGAPQQLALVKQAGRRMLYTACFDSGQLIEVDVDTKTTSVITTGLGHPIGLVLDTGKKLAYVTEQDKRSLTRVKLVGGSQAVLYKGLVFPFFLAWDKTRKGIFCVQRDPANSLVRLELGQPVTVSSVATGLAWRPSGVAPNIDDTKIYVCADQKLQLISFNGVPHITPDPAPFEIHSIEFNYDKSSAIKLKDHFSGSLIPRPEYIRGSRNQPAAYVTGTLPKIKVVLRKLPGYVAGSYAIGAVGSLGGVKRKYLTPAFNASGLTNPIEFELMWPLPRNVGKPNVSLDWYARKTWVPCVPVSIGSASHKIFLTVDRPKAPWVAEVPWVGALEVACDWAAGAANQDMAAAGITKGLNSFPLLRYHGATTFGYVNYLLSSFLQQMNVGTPFYLNCTDCADALVTLANLLGCDLCEGRMDDLFTYEFLPLHGNAANDNDWVDYDWIYHEIGWLHSIGPNELVYDGCLQLDLDTNHSDSVHIPHLPVKMKFADYRSYLVKSGSCTLASGCQRRPIA